jgi:hypothetical protein
MAMKGVSLIMEYALLFMFSVAIFLACVGFFNSYQAHFNEVGVRDQVSKVTEYIESSIIKMSERAADEDSSLRLAIPKKAGNEDYRIDLSPNGLNVTSLNTYFVKHSDLFNIGKNIGLQGRALSTSGSIVIYKTGNKIIIS